MFRCCANGVLRTGVTLAASKRVEVWGSPISHSLSPVLHNTAYALLGLDAIYGAREVGVAALPGALAGVGGDYLGLSLTMPLKEAVLGLVSDHRGLVDELGAANTLVVTSAGPCLWNTDPAGVTGALRDAGVTDATSAVILGAGATARAAVAGLADLGVTSVVIASRDSSRSQRTLEVVTGRGLHASWVALEDIATISGIDVVVNTVPAGVDLSGFISAEVVASAALFDVTYNPWPSPAATRWSGSTTPVVSGLSMLVHQAVVQIRLFTTGDPGLPLEGEEQILAAMKASVGLPAV